MIYFDYESICFLPNWIGVFDVIGYYILEMRFEDAKYCCFQLLEA